MSLIPGAVIDQVIPENDSVGQNTAPRVRQKKQQQTNKLINKNNNKHKDKYTKHQTTRNRGGHLLFYLMILFRN